MDDIFHMVNTELGVRPISSLGRCDPTLNRQHQNKEKCEGFHMQLWPSINQCGVSLVPRLISSSTRGYKAKIIEL